MSLKSIQLLLSVLGWLREPQVKQVNILILTRKIPGLKYDNSCLEVILDQRVKQVGNKPSVEW